MKFDELDRLSDEEFLRLFGRIYDEFMKNLDDDDYRVNPPQWAALMNLVGYFNDLAEKSHGYIDPVKLQPKLVSGCVTLYVTVLSLKGEDVKEFCSMLSKCISFSLDATTDGKACLSVCVPDVFVRKETPS